MATAGGRAPKGNGDGSPATFGRNRRLFDRRGESAERQWRRRLASVGTGQVRRPPGERAERQWRPTHPQVLAHVGWMTAGGRTPKGNGDLKSVANLMNLFSDRRGESAERQWRPYSLLFGRFLQRDRRGENAERQWRLTARFSENREGHSPRPPGGERRKAMETHLTRGMSPLRCLGTAGGRAPKGNGDFHSFLSLNCFGC